MTPARRAAAAEGRRRRRRRQGPRVVRRAGRGGRRRREEPVDARHRAVVRERVRQGAPPEGAGVRVRPVHRGVEGGPRPRVVDQTKVAVRRRRVEPVPDDGRAAREGLPRPEVALPVAWVARHDDPRGAHEPQIVGAQRRPRRRRHFPKIPAQIPRRGVGPRPGQDPRARGIDALAHAQRTHNIQRPPAGRIRREVRVRDGIGEGVGPRAERRLEEALEGAVGLAHEAPLVVREVFFSFIAAVAARPVVVLVQDNEAPAGLLYHGYAVRPLRQPEHDVGVRLAADDFYARVRREALI